MKKLFIFIFLLILNYNYADLKTNPPKGFLSAIRKLKEEEIKQIYLLERINQFFLELPKDELLPVITEKDREKGYILFLRHYTVPVYPNSAPKQDEVLNERKEIEVYAAKGEYEPITIGVYPIEDLKKVNVKVSDLIGKDGKIGANNIEVYLVDYQIIGKKPLYRIWPGVLTKDKDMNLNKEECWRYWITIYVPENISEGEYKGVIEFSCENKPKTQVNIKLTVYPFSLPENTDVSFGLWGSFARGEEGIIDQKKHGINAVSLGAKWKIDEDGKPVITNMNELESCVYLIKKYNLKGPHWLMPDYNRFKTSPEYDKAYIEVVKKVWNWAKEKGIDIVLWPADEPRETREDFWRLNFDELYHLLSLYKNIPEVKKGITFTGDSKSVKGNDYSEVVPMLDIVCIHSNKPISQFRLVQAAIKYNKEIWIYNSGNFRYSWGFVTWKWNAKGRWEWAYSPAPPGEPLWWPGMYNLTYSPVGKSSVTNPEPRPHWEIAREGIDDYKYIYLLETLIKKSEKEGTKKEIIEKAKEFLVDMKNKFPEVATKVTYDSRDAADRLDTFGKPEELDQTRRNIANFIIQLIK
jgi:hypothetical protein